MKQFLSTLCCLIAIMPARAQSGCRSTDYRLQQFRTHPSLAQTASAIESFTAEQLRNRPVIVTGGQAGATESSRSGNAEVPPITIPVIVHIVYHTAAENISDAQVQSQIAVLNADYQKKNADTSGIPACYRELAANCGFRFGLAMEDTAGRPSTGIVRKYTDTEHFSLDDGIKFSARGGDDGWDRDRYLNIWVGNLTGGILGYSSIVGGTKATDGVVVLYTAFGTNGAAAAPYNLGRTTTHEVGHWLNMIHTWGDDSCGTDDVADTPPQEGPDYGDPEGTIVSCGNAPYGNLYMDFMDFTDDIGMHLFTFGQRDRMRTLFAPGGFRYALLSSTVPVSAPASAGVPGAPEPPGLRVYPNPVSSIATIDLPDPGSIGGLPEVYDGLGTRVAALRISAQVIQLDVAAWKSGVYFLRISGGRRAIAGKLLKL